MKRPQRPLRGQPNETRARLVAAAAAELESPGYFATDSNRIARAAGYAPGTFYKHFADKRAIFLAVYDSWVASEWLAIAELVGRGRPLRAIIPETVDLVIAHHRRWRTFRASLRALSAIDPLVRRHHRRRRVEQLRTLGRFQPRRGAGAAVLLLTFERVCDAIADGELRAMSVSDAVARAYLIERLRELVGG